MSQLNNKYVKKFYDEFRDCELNKEYYAARMATIRTKLKALNIFLALFAGSSAVLSFAFWQYTIIGFPVGALCIGTLAGIAIMLSIAKPYLGLESDLERVSSIQGVYSVLSALQKDVVNSIRTQENVTNKEEFASDIMRRMRISVDAKEDKPADTCLVEKLEVVVNKRYPNRYFWYPEREKT
jgi:hypothetical protein